MEYSAIKIDPNDNVITTLKPFKRGETATYVCNEADCEVAVREDIPIYHKIVLCDLRKGDAIYKYGESLGLLSCDVMAGDWISHINLESQPRNYDEETI